MFPPPAAPVSCPEHPTPTYFLTLLILYFACPPTPYFSLQGTLGSHCCRKSLTAPVPVSQTWDRDPCGAGPTGSSWGAVKYTRLQAQLTPRDPDSQAPRRYMYKPPAARREHG